MVAAKCPSLTHSVHTMLIVQKVREMIPILTASGASAPMVTTAEVRSVFLGENPWKSAESNGVPGYSLGICIDQLEGKLTDILNIPLFLFVVPICFKRSSTIPVSKKSKVTYHNDQSPVALTSPPISDLRGWA